MKTNTPWIAASLGLLLAACQENTKISHKEGAEAKKSEATTMVLPKEISFNEHIQPILSEYCYHCHGPDSGTRMPEKEPLRLDMEEDAFKMRDLGSPVIIKGKPAESELIRLIKSKDIAEVMPPPESHKVMNAREIALLEKWIEQGAEYQKHWSYEPVVRAEPAKNDWSDKAIDGFVLEKLQEAGLNPNPDEEARRFHRRLSLDLTGLPPEPAETDAFVASYEKGADAAISAEADRMLASVQSAEHFSRHWLDASRYADTHGIHFDNFRSIWPYRDWVVRAFQSNMKWDQFTTEQIAGDLMQNPSMDQKIATGFLRALSTTGEGGAIGEEYDAIYAADRVDTMGAIWLGMTASCASCHDHKFDPLATKEFYQLTAFFRNNTMSALDGNNAAHPPAINVPYFEHREKLGQLQAAIAQLQGRINERRAAAHGEFQNWLSTASQTIAKEMDTSYSIHLPLNDIEGNVRGVVDGTLSEWATAATRIDSQNGKALLVSSAETDLGDLGKFSRKDQVSYGAFIRIEGTPSGAVVARMDPANGHKGWDLWLEGGRIGAHVIESWPASAIKTLSAEALAPNVWHHVIVVFDGSNTSDKVVSIYVDGKLSATSGGLNDPNAIIEANVPLRLGSRIAGDGKLANGAVAIQDFRFYRKILSEIEINNWIDFQNIKTPLDIAEVQRTPEQNQKISDYFFTRVDAPSLAMIREMQALKTSEAQIPFATTLVFEENQGQEAFAHILTRGDYRSKAERVTPNTPAYLVPMAAEDPKNRLGLAKWLNNPQNPLPARVTMNRLWYYIFGNGIVDSTGDFGIMGARPTHPKLLDWLASEFIASGWDYRHMVKTIVSSKTYRQSGNVSAEKLEIDPKNSLISHGPRTRLEAEQLRDLALSASGLLVKKIGGPPVNPYQPPGVWESVAMPQSNTKDYKQDVGESLYRRSFYTLWKRSAHPATMEILDAPSREKFCVKRDRTNTPLQALALMNDPQFVEAGKILASKAIAASSDFDARVDLMSSRLIARKMDSQERVSIKATLDNAIVYYTAKPEEASQAISVGETKALENIPAPELAAWTLVAGQLMNLDETLTR
jgi:hypothetical protein